MSFHIGHIDLTEKEVACFGAAPNQGGSLNLTHPSLKKVVSVTESQDKISEVNSGSETQSDTSSENKIESDEEATV
jgi:hypothetical protein